MIVVCSTVVQKCPWDVNLVLSSIVVGKYVCLSSSGFFTSYIPRESVDGLSTWRSTLLQSYTPDSAFCFSSSNKVQVLDCWEFGGQTSERVKGVTSSCQNLAVSL